ncbi:MAG: hypothetical protein HC895_05885 [Leptolyngbyaceae cyanobacterium SM1_3_5]|nr:hypothetical protein [Leptolyngbyaceae cyanobacterium SM1_3_5]
MKDDRSQEQILESLAVIHEVMGAFERSIEYYEQRLMVVRQLADPKLEQQSIDSLKNAYCAIGEFAKANQIDSTETANSIETANFN